MTTIRTVERTLPYLAMTITWLFPVTAVEAFGRLEKNWKFPKLQHTRFTTLATLCLVVFLLTLIPVKDLDYEFYEYNDNVQPTMEIMDEYPMEETAVYSAMTYMVNFNRALIEPDGNHFELTELISESPWNFTPDHKYTFIYIENTNYTFKILREGWSEFNTTENVMTETQRWIDAYTQSHDNIELFYESDQLRIYLITRR
jgi:hypothetical protein